MKARLLTTLRCTRHCSYCCNRFPRNVERRKVVGLRDVDWSQYTEVSLSGGEPLLEIGYLKQVIAFIRPQVKILYLYTSIWHDGLQSIITSLDGIHWTIHAAKRISPEDLAGFDKIQTLISRCRNWSLPFSARLAISPDISTPLLIVPSLWKEIRIKRWRNAAEKSVMDEDHYLLE